MVRKIFCAGQIGIALLLTVSAGMAAPASSPVPLPRAHAHNDYAHARPLFDALERGFCSVEADVWLVDGKPLVAHDREQVKPERTLEALYLDPLRERAKRNGGRVYRGGPECSLLIDVKSEAESTWAALQAVLKNYADTLTSFRVGQIESKAITVIISGNRARAAMRAKPVRLAACDGRLDDLDGDEPSHFIAWISGDGAFPDDERAKLRQIVAKAHAQGRRVRFWATPDQPEFWHELLAADVDLINADNLPGLQKFLLEASR